MPTSIRASIVPYIGAVVCTVIIWASYFIARDKNPPDVKPFPITDITHCGTYYPEYIVFRIGLNCVLPIISLCWYLVQNHLQILYFQIKGQQNSKLWIIGLLGVVSAFSLGVSTSTISDGGDMSGKWHGRGAKWFFILSFVNCLYVGYHYRHLWKTQKNFVAYWSYLYKISGWLSLAFILLLSTLEDHKYIGKSNLVQWYGTFYIIGYIASFGIDFAKLNITFKKK